MGNWMRNGIIFLDDFLRYFLRISLLFSMLRILIFCILIFQRLPKLFAPTVYDAKTGWYRVYKKPQDLAKINFPSLLEYMENEKKIRVVHL
jgi:hypothetical protein